MTARFWDSQLEWSIHETPALEAGLSADTIDSIRHRETPSFQLSDESAVYLYTHELLHEHFVSDKVFADTLQHIGQRSITELTILIGYYTLVAFSLNAFPIEPPRRRDTASPRHAGTGPVARSGTFAHSIHRRLTLSARTYRDARLSRRVLGRRHTR